MLTEAYGEMCMTEYSFREWFRRFKDDEFAIEDRAKIVNILVSERQKFVEDERMSCSNSTKPLLGDAPDPN